MSEPGLSDAPLATFEMDEFCEEFAELQCAVDNSAGASKTPTDTSKLPTGASNTPVAGAPGDVADLSITALDNAVVGGGGNASPGTTPTSASSSSSSSPNAVDNRPSTTSAAASTTTTMVDNFTENFSGSLEDLVSTFDEKITKCFSNFDETTERIAPVQVRVPAIWFFACVWL